MQVIYNCGPKVSTSVVSYFLSLASSTGFAGESIAASQQHAKLSSRDSPAALCRRYHWRWRDAVRVQVALRPTSRGFTRLSLLLPHRLTSPQHPGSRRDSWTLWLGCNLSGVSAPAARVGVPRVCCLDSESVTCCSPKTSAGKCGEPWLYLFVTSQRRSMPTSSSVISFPSSIHSAGADSPVLGLNFVALCAD